MKNGKGYSADNLKLMRRFYLIYSKDQIGETVFPQFENYPKASREDLRKLLEEHRGETKEDLE